MKSALYLVFGLTAYLVFFATFLYLIAFVGGLPTAPRTVDRGGIVGPAAAAIALDLLLVALFGLQHSIMARPAFKRAWTRIVPAPIERSVYVLSASIMLLIMFQFWRPIPASVWAISDPVATVVIWCLFGLGWLIVLISTFLISHFELFGLTQVWSHARGASPLEPTFRTPFFYKWVRHPLYSGFILAFFATPEMTAGHLLLATAMLCYILIAIGHEERDLVAVFGQSYIDYRGRVGMLSPRWRKSRG